MLNDNVILLPVKNDPAVSIKVWIKAGAQNDPEGKEGLAYISARMISESPTKNHNYEEILGLLYPMAARYTCTSSMEMTVYSGRVHVDNLKLFYPLFIEGIICPAFNENDLKRIKDETLNYLNTTLKYSNDEELAKSVLYNSIFSNTPYGHIVEGTISGLNNITIDDVRDFYRTFYTRNNIVPGLAGNYPEDLQKNLIEDLTKLTECDQNSLTDHAPEITPEKINGLNVSIVEKEADATSISIGFPINVIRGSKEWYALAVANSWFGEHRSSSSHLYQFLREARGLNYGDYSYIENFPDSSYYQMPKINVSRRRQIFEIWIRPVSNKDSHFVLRAVLHELKRLVDIGMDKESFELTKNFLKKYILHFAPDTDTRLGYALDDKFYGLNTSHLKTFREMMDILTLQDVNNAIRKNLQYENMHIVFVTADANDLKYRIAGNFPSPVAYSCKKDEEVYIEDSEIENFRLNISEENIEIIKVDNLFG